MYFFQASIHVVECHYIIVHTEERVQEIHSQKVKEKQSLMFWCLTNITHQKFSEMTYTSRYRLFEFLSVWKELNHKEFIQKELQKDFSERFPSQPSAFFFVSFSNCFQFKRNQVSSQLSGVFCSCLAGLEISHWLSERLVSLGIMGALIKAPLPWTPLYVSSVK